MRWVADEPGQSRKAAALRRLAQAPWGRLAGAAETATRRMPPVDGRCTVTFRFSRPKCIARRTRRGARPSGV